MIKILELKIPPPVVAIGIALLMWSVFNSASSAQFLGTAHMILVATLAGIGLSFDLLALGGFLQAKTTINPMRPRVTSTVVTTGVYRITRNPMYLGLVFFLGAWASYLWLSWALLGPVLFVAYITRFQIMPEERVLSATFGKEYEAYMKKVRRWL